ncbi:dihydrofolate reductase family protein [Agromyces larvae]|uniref:Dihydrofolate reductase family protein n=1 Tax=Agromyces larvae TaxID=2929802 RepID=A0ABY4C0P9_9MICO|nr:dihydrofolate reductase family protein [Agromyces larvae]UOE43543.1 dihydrofolate reductase family protein [Agromyces larvae]
MGALLYSISISLDGYVCDEHGNFDWGAPTEEEHAFINDRLRGLGTFVFGRRLYETMRVWETLDLQGQSPAVAEFAALWHDTDKIVCSTTLGDSDITTARTRLVRRLGVDDLRALAEASDRDVEVGGPTLAADAIRAGAVDRISFYILPVVVGGGTRALPDRARLDLELTEEHRFPSGKVFVSYLVRR